MALSSSKSKSTSQQNTSGSATTTKNVPDWLLGLGQTNAGNYGALLGTPSSTYTPQTSAAQQTAWGNISGQTANPLYDQAATSVSGIDYSSPGFLSGIDKYLNPYLDQVVNTTLDDYDVNSGKVRAQQAANAARNQGFRDTRFGLREAATEGELARGRATTAAGLRSQAFNTASQLAVQEEQARQQAVAQQLQGSGLLSDIAGSQNASDLSRLGLQLNAGEQATAQENASRQFPLQYQEILNGLFAGLNPELFTGQTTNTTGSMTGTNTQTNTPSLMNQIGQAAQIAALFSDSRLKRDIKRIGKTDSGLPIYSYRYIGSDKTQIGVMAQDVKRVNPAAVIKHESGYLMVDYGAI